MFSVKGLSTSSAELNPHDSGMAILEIMIMLVGALFIGYGIAWQLREINLSQKRRDIQIILDEREALKEKYAELKERAIKAEHILKRARQTFHDDYISITREKEKITLELETIKQTLFDLETEKSRIETDNLILQQAKSQLEKALAREQLLKLELEANLVQALHNSKPKEYSSAFNIDRIQIATDIEKEDIDDLKQIKGIGPVLEKKLNILGIVSFKQLSELDDEAVNQIAHTLKFFPDRIKRDRWIQQAKELFTFRKTKS
jgi:predicted flap endonuclease-1-like 5' DNA nuclease